MLFLRQEDLIQCVGSRQVQEYAVGMVGDAEVGQQRRECRGTSPRHGHPPGLRSEAEFDIEVRRPLWIRQQAGEEGVVVHDESALVECQRVEQLLRTIEGEDTDVVADEQDVGAGAHRQTDRLCRQVIPTGDLPIRRADDDGLRLVVVRPNECDLIVALDSMTHGGNDEVDVLAGDERDAGFRIDRHWNQADAQEVGDVPGNVDLVAGKSAAGVADGESRVIGAQSDAKLPVAQYAHQHIGWP